MDAVAQGAGALAVDYADVLDPLVEAFLEVGGQQFADLRRAKGVEIELGGDGDAVGIVFDGGRIVTVVRCIKARMTGSGWMGWEFSGDGAIWDADQVERADPPAVPGVSS